MFYAASVAKAHWKDQAFRGCTTIPTHIRPAPGGRNVCSSALTSGSPAHPARRGNLLVCPCSRLAHKLAQSSPASRRIPPPRTVPIHAYAACCTIRHTTHTHLLQAHPTTPYRTSANPYQVTCRLHAKVIRCTTRTHPLRGPGRGCQQPQLRHLVSFPQLPGSFLHVQGRRLRVVEALTHVLALPVPFAVLRQLRPPGVGGALVGPHLCARQGRWCDIAFVYYES